MADQKISELTALTGANLADVDAFAVVDTSAVQTKKITYAELKTALDTGTGFVRITGDTMTGNLSFGDNNKAIFGAGSDLQIYHDGDDSIIRDVGTGDLRLRGTSLAIEDSSGNEFIKCSDGGTGGTVFLKHLGAIKLTTTSTGIDVTGTLTADGLTVDNVDINGATVAWQNGGTNQTYFATTGSSEQALILRLDNQNLSSAGYFEVQDGSAGRKVLTVEDGGDISFYEDTGTTPKFFWDASAERLGIGTSSPDRKFHIKTENNIIGSIESTDADAWLAFKDNTSSTDNAVRVGATGDNLRFYAGAAERMRIDSDGNVGIGTSSPNSYAGYTTLTLNGTSGSLLDFEVNGTITGELYADATTAIGMQAVGSRYIQFKTNN